ncbi:MAG: DUF3301 domain-containing protein [Gammaproteobacteria bacterium]|nr:DUF3301 domain-containing protein [Gammaproteobacteria bacterium]MDH5735188.1 DUF3301 domain-containing protein [Gammaproteobacteria bacterium]
MLSDELFILLGIGLIVLYWYDAMHAREMARKASIKACQSSDVAFLDDTVSLVKLRLKKDRYGRFTIYREYQFDFTSDGYSRHHGLTTLYGKQVAGIDLGVFRL